MNKSLRIVCLGDSITYGFPWGPMASWAAMLDEALDGEVINQGINGNTTFNMFNRFDRAVLKYNPSHVVIMGGTNDVICGESFDRICLNIRGMVEKAENAGIKVVLGIPAAVDEPYWEKLLLRLRNWIKDLAGQKNLPVIDFSRPFYDEKGRVKSELLLADGGHPSKAGYRAMFEQIDLALFA